MKYALKENLKLCFEAPQPLHKKEFLQKLPPPQMNLCEFILSQVGYIRRWIWSISAFVFIVSLWSGNMFPSHMLWIISALTPLLALTILSECGRSVRYDMNELEMATRFSLRSVMIARLGILGVENLLIFCLLMPVSIGKHLADPIWTGLYILTPYLLTSFIGLSIVRKFRGPEAIYICAVAAVCVSLSILLFYNALLIIFSENYLLWWVAAAFTLCVGTVKQTFQFVNQTEELV